MQLIEVTVGTNFLPSLRMPEGIDLEGLYSKSVLDQKSRVWYDRWEGMDAATIQHHIFMNSLF